MVGLGELTRRHAILVYVVAIAVPALVLLYFGIESFERQRQAVATLVRSNLRLSGERLVAELERRTTELAQACLREAVRVPLHRTELEGFRAKHPVARYFFVFEGGRVVYPPVHTPVRSVEDAFYEAEKQEFRQQNCGAATANYRKAATLQVYGSLKALASFRVARCLEKMNRAAQAAQSYETVGLPPAADYPAGGILEMSF